MLVLDIRGKASVLKAMVSKAAVKDSGFRGIFQLPKRFSKFKYILCGRIFNIEEEEYNFLTKKTIIFFVAKKKIIY